MPLALCREIQEHSGDALTVIDSVLWRYGEQQKARGWPAWDELFSDAEWPELLEDKTPAPVQETLKLGE